MTGSDRLADAAEIERMVRLVDPDWTVREDAAVSSGRHHLHRLTIDTADGLEECVLKAPEDDVDFCDEARLLAALGAHTDLPVPEVLGVVDDHEAVPTPFFVMTALPGESVHKTDIESLSRETLGRIAVSSGRKLHRLHALDAVETYGAIHVDRDETLAGGVPSGDLDRLTVPDGDRSWPEHVETSVDGILEALDDPRFEEVVPDVRCAADGLLADLRAAGPFEPVVGRVEHSLDNVLVDRDDGEVTALLDWEFVAASTAAHDLVLAEYWLSGGTWGLLPSTPDYRRTVREGLLEGYRDAGGGAAVKEFRSHRDLYALLAHLRTMQLFDGMLDAMDASGEQRKAAAAGLRRRVEEVIERA